MLVADRFVFLHMPKTGGGSIRGMLMPELGPTVRRTASPALRHPRWDDIPHDARDRPVLLYVRNPWDWYVSLYAFMTSRRKDSVVWRSAFASGGNDFATTVRNLCEGRVVGKQETVRTRIAAGADFYTAHLLDFYRDGVEGERLVVKRFERLVPDLEDFLAHAGVMLPDGAGDRFRSARRVHRSERPPYRELYDESLRDLVAEKCAWMIERFGYTF